MSTDTIKLERELAFWRREKVKMIAGKQDRVAWLTNEALFIKGMLQRATRTELGESSRILQVGVGPCDVIDFWRGGERHAIDPLAAEYKEEFAEFQDSAVAHTAGGGESLPYASDYFDAIIIRNALDHVSDAHKVLAECLRVIRPEGALYIWVHLYSAYGSACYRLINFLTNHYAVEPWAFTPKRLERFLEQAGFRPYMPMTEDRPERNRDRTPRQIAKHLIKKSIGLDYHKGFACASVPRKGVPRPWMDE
jgi:ubiquinone/menaquinone biosynthesis C-methylase UbiE